MTCSKSPNLPPSLVRSKGHSYDFGEGALALGEVPVLLVLLLLGCQRSSVQPVSERVDTALHTHNHDSEHQSRHTREYTCAPQKMLQDQF